MAFGKTALAGGARSTTRPIERSRGSAMPLNASSGGAAVGVRTCCAPGTWSRRTEQSISAGFCIAHRSSLTEMTGNSRTSSTPSAMNGSHRSCFSRFSNRSHRHRLVKASNAQAELRNSSIQFQIVYRACLPGSQIHLTPASNRDFSRQDGGAASAGEQELQPELFQTTFAWIDDGCDHRGRD